jgi:hypothetical protein
MRYAGRVRQRVAPGPWCIGFWVLWLLCGFASASDDADPAYLSPFHELPLPFPSEPDRDLSIQRLPRIEHISPPEPTFAEEPVGVVIAPERRRHKWAFWPDLGLGIVPVIGSRSAPFNRLSRWGQPLEGISWLDHPLSLGLGFGGVEGTSPIRRHVDQQWGFLASVNYGWDYDHRWGIEKRGAYIGFAAKHADRHSGPALVHAYLGEYRLMHYPLGNTRWRPYAMIALGVAEMGLQATNGRTIQDSLFVIPFGAGLKYMHSPRWASRIEIVDDLMLGAESGEPTHNISIMAGIEIRFSAADVFPKRSPTR